LKNLVWNKMMPESRNKNLITDKDVLHIFGFGCVEELLPAPSKIETCHHYIKRNCYDEIKNKILQESATKFHIHAGAGCGKSTFVNHLTNTLTEDLFAIIFDCYGGGTYLDPSDRRHKHRWGILQIANELAIKVGSPFLLMQNESDERFLRELKKRLELAIQILRKQNPNVILLLILDAGDNSITAANGYAAGRSDLATWSEGRYWSSTVDSQDNASFLHFNVTGVKSNESTSGERTNGHSVRCIME
jgi:hypothetical protein